MEQLVEYFQTTPGGAIEEIRYYDNSQFSSELVGIFFADFSNAVTTPIDEILINWSPIVQINFIHPSMHYKGGAKLLIRPPASMLLLLKFGNREVISSQPL